MSTEDLEEFRRLKEQVETKLTDLGKELVSEIEEDAELYDQETVEYLQELIQQFNRQEGQLSYWEVVALDRSIGLWLSLRLRFMQGEVRRYKAKNNASKPKTQTSYKNLQRDLRVIQRAKGWKQSGRENHELTGLIMSHVPDSPSAPTIRKILRDNGIIPQMKKNES